MDPALLALVAGGACALVAVMLLGRRLITRRRPAVKITITPDALPPRSIIPNAGGPADVLDVPLSVAGGRDPYLERLMSRAGEPAWPGTGRLALDAGRDGPPWGADAATAAWDEQARVPALAFAGSHEPRGARDLAVPHPESDGGSAGVGRAEPAHDDAAVPRTFADAGAAGPPGTSPGAGALPSGDLAGGDAAAPGGIAPSSDTAEHGPETPGALAPCSEERRLVAERCSVAVRARETYQMANDTFRATQREYDRTVEAVDQARRTVDGRRVLDEKAEAQRRFRAARMVARNAAEIEQAAGNWLHDVNRINAAVRHGNVQLAHGRERMTQLVQELERQSARLDAARIAVASAEEDCQQAREALAACEEARSGTAAVAALLAQPPREVAGRPGVPAPLARPEATPVTGAGAPTAAVPGPPSPDEPGGPVSGPEPPTELPRAAPELPPAAPAPPPAAATAPLPPPGGAPASPTAARPAGEATGQPSGPASGQADETMPLGRAPYGATPMVLRILRGDRDALDRVVRVLAAGSDAEARRWHLDLGALVDAIVAAAIDAAALELPQDHAFWSNFSPSQARQVAEVLGGLGSRYDGRGGFADGRVPSARDLALAVGYTGIDPRRIRHWPNEAQMAELYRNVAVAADAFVSEGAPDLTLGQMVGLLGRHAETLTAVWDEWGRVRPLLLAGGS